MKAFAQFAFAAVFGYSYCMLTPALRADEATEIKGANVVGVQYAKLGDTTVFGGIFRMPDGDWIERNGDGVNRFQETSRDEWSVYLSREGDVHLAVDLYQKNVKLQNGDYQPLYDIVRAHGEPVAVGHNLTSVEVKDVGSANVIGGFVLTGGNGWMEFKDGEVNHFTEARRDEHSVELLKSDGAKVVIDLHRKKVRLKTITDADFRDLYDIARAHCGLPGDHLSVGEPPVTIRVSNLRINGRGLPETETADSSIQVSFDYDVFVPDSAGEPNNQECVALHVLLTGRRGGSETLLQHVYGRLSGTSGERRLAWPSDALGELSKVSVYLVAVRTNDPIRSYQQAAIAAAENPNLKVDPNQTRKILLATLQRPKSDAP